MVIGIGNTMRRDDGVGIVAVQRLGAAVGLDGVDVMTMDGEATRLIEAWAGADRVVVVDAMRSGEPAGTVRRIEVGREVLPTWAPGASSHHAGLAAAVDLGRALDRLPGHLVIYGVEVREVAAGEGLSPEVETALPDLVRQLAAELDLERVLHRHGGKPTPNPVVGRARTRQRLDVTGVVQGVGFRPFVHRLAGDLRLGGYVRNELGRVHIEIEGTEVEVGRFGSLLRAQSPPLAAIETVATEPMEPRGEMTFRIVDSLDPAEGASPPRVVPPDVATCDDCVTELCDPTDRRYRHPFITCTNCGPRFTIITELPYDRPNTTMAGFELCAACAAEYHDPTDRRFHAQPLACPACGPTLRHEDADGFVTAGADAVIAAVQTDLAAGGIVAVKGLGGYHLACDATDDGAVERLRRRKHRPDKPLAVMVPDLAAARLLAHIDPVEAAVLSSPERPIVLLRRRDDADLAASVVPNHPLIGLMLPSTPLHHLLFAPVPGRPVEVPGVLVMTSGNLVEEPICYRDDEVRDRLGGIVDSFCHHDRPIHVPCDDSVVRVIGGAVAPIRRSRGYAPAAVALPFSVGPTLAVGGEIKNTFALARGRHAWLSQHIGDMENLETLRAFDRSVDAFGSFHHVRPERIAADAHPGYRTGRWAIQHADGRPVIDVQHHHAHLAALMVEHGWSPDESLLGFVFDGTGYGTDGDLWGGEVLLADYAHAHRLGSLVPVPLPGGEGAVRNPCRVALAHLAAANIGWGRDLAPVVACDPTELRILEQQVRDDAAQPRTTSMGRLFDAVASLLDLQHRITYEAQAAIQLEFLAASATAPADGVAFGLDDGRIDPAPVLEAIVDGLRVGTDRAELALAFHHAVADVIARVALDVGRNRPVPTVGLTGGCFQNALLTELATSRLVDEGFAVLTHGVVPANDGGIALGQLAVAAQADGATPEDGGD